MVVDAVAADVAVKTRLSASFSYTNKFALKDMAEADMAEVDMAEVDMAEVDMAEADMEEEPFQSTNPFQSTKPVCSSKFESSWIRD
jgi:hypothetical protein